MPQILSKRTGVKNYLVFLVGMGLCATSRVEVGGYMGALRGGYAMYVMLIDGRLISASSVITPQIRVSMCARDVEHSARETISRTRNQIRCMRCIA